MMTQYDKRANTVAGNAVGEEVRLHIGPDTYIPGVICACSHVGWWTNDTQHKKAKFAVTIRAGKDLAFQYKYTVLEVPAPGMDYVPEIRVLEFPKESWVDQGVG